MFNFLSIILLSFALPAFAGSSHVCTAWTQQSGISCIFAEESANIYQRQCENPCHVGHNGNELEPAQLV
ncbi:MAG: hypothetical protein H7281_17675 [Bacteriovorax sp.]|nr:hypothetical protein [Bacteriovorax sp.]